MSEMDLLELEQRKEQIEEMTPVERGIYADMLMRSLRGSWRSPQKRTRILELVSHYDIEIYDAETLREKVDSYFSQIGRNRPDGRWWRGYYQEKDVDHTQIPEERFQELADMIPDDKTWDEWIIEGVYDDE